MQKHYQDAAPVSEGLHQPEHTNVAVGEKYVFKSGPIQWLVKGSWHP